LSRTITNCSQYLLCPRPENESSFDNGMMVNNGGILYSIVDKRMVGAIQGGLIHVIFCKKGPEAMCQVFTSIQMAVSHWLF
ncbi:hypothetical protein EDD17DRAFT_1428700, partial [Pisolithus thermaeus]